MRRGGYTRVWPGLRAILAAEADFWRRERQHMRAVKAGESLGEEIGGVTAKRPVTRPRTVAEAIRLGLVRRLPDQNTPVRVIAVSVPETPEMAGFHVVGSVEELVEVS